MSHGEMVSIAPKIIGMTFLGFLYMVSIGRKRVKAMGLVRAVRAIIKPVNMENSIFSFWLLLIIK
jgi:hypothetical protein